MKDSYYKEAGFISKESFLRFQENVAQGMINYGNKFERRLGRLLIIADEREALRIIATWRSKCMEYEIIYRTSQAKEKALNAVNES